MLFLIEVYFHSLDSSCFCGCCLFVVEPFSDISDGVVALTNLYILSYFSESPINDLGKELCFFVLDNFADSEILSANLSAKGFVTKLGLGDGGNIGGCFLAQAPVESLEVFSGFLFQVLQVGHVLRIHARQMWDMTVEFVDGVETSQGVAIDCQVLGWPRLSHWLFADAE